MHISGKHISNNNQSAVSMLSKACRRYGRGRDRILAGATAVGIMVLCSVFSIASGKIEAGYLQSIRSNGTAAATYLQRGTMEQYEAIRRLDYVEAAGREVDAGYVHQNGRIVFVLEALDDTAWETMKKPAYTHIHGQYPRKEGELMLAKRALEELQVSHPEEGMKLTLTADLDTGAEETVEFTLCGWYTDYVDPVFPSRGYISEVQAEKWGKSLEEPDAVLICQKDTIDGYQIEERLYEDIPMRDKAQQFRGENPFLYSEYNGLFGGYGMAAFCAALVLTGVFFLIYNIFGISMQKEIRQIGLLDTLGTTRRQIRAVYLRQTGCTIFQGTLAGTAGAMAIVLFAVPRALGNLYLHNYGKSADLLVFRPELFGASAVFTVGVVFGAAACTIYQAARLTPLEALGYQGTGQRNIRKKPVKRAEAAGSEADGKSVRPDHQEGQAQVPLCRKPARSRFMGKSSRRQVFAMAWRNLFRSRKRCFLTILSLFLGVVTALGAVVLTKGTDVTHSIEKRADFVISGNHFGQYTSEMAARSGLEGEEEPNTMHGDFTPITGETRERLLSVQGVQEENCSIVRGAYVYVDGRAESMKPWGDAMGTEPQETAESRETAEGDKEAAGMPSFWREATVHIVDEELIRQLEEYAKDNGLAVDMESLREGTGTIFLHYHAFSPSIQEEADQKQGLPVTFWRLPSGEERTSSWETMDRAGFEDWRQEKGQITEMKLAGYLDIKSKGFPDFRREINGNFMYFLVSETGFEKLGISEKTFVMELNAEREQEPAAKAAIRKILQEENCRDVCLGLNVLCKSDELADAREYIRTNRILLWALSLVLVLMGFLNYLNVIVTGILSRQRELAVLECVGMTGRQIRRMLAAEGGLYCVIVGALVLTAGSGLLQLFRMYMESRIAYFKFSYPGTAAGAILAVIFGACISVPPVMYKRMEKRSMTRRAAEE